MEARSESMWGPLIENRSRAPVGGGRYLHATLSRADARKNTARRVAAGRAAHAATCGARPTYRKKDALPPSASRATCWSA
jgi:hypothetical protein